MLSIETLRAYGANVDEGLARCLNDEEFYLSLVRMALEDDRLPRLREALSAGDRAEAFEIAHALKGIYGNVALTPLFEPVSELTEMLRGEDISGDTAGCLRQIEERTLRLSRLCEDENEKAGALE